MRKLDSLTVVGRPALVPALAILGLVADGSRSPTIVAIEGLLAIFRVIALVYLSRSLRRAVAANAEICLLNALVREKLSGANDRFEKTFRWSPAMIAIAGLEDSVAVDINNAWLESLGYRREEVIGRSMIELGFWVEHAERKTAVERLRVEGSIRNLEVRYRTKTGQYFHAIEPIELDGKEVVFAVA
ncbi:MAG: PAS domain S-box protein [Alphaproteobacteria bacterium]|nr:PAS domain S-box protein [Alphaproteobacteria bacterium]